MDIGLHTDGSATSGIGSAGTGIHYKLFEKSIAAG
jgi:hypothetical protein